MKNDAGRSTVVALQPGGVIVHKPFDVPHKSRDLHDLAQYLGSLEGDTRVVMESTGRYHEPIRNALSKAGLFVCTVNPHLIKNYGNNTIRKVKPHRAAEPGIEAALRRYRDLPERSFSDPADGIRPDRTEQCQPGQEGHLQQRLLSETSGIRCTGSPASDCQKTGGAPGSVVINSYT